MSIGFCFSAIHSAERLHFPAIQQDLVSLDFSLQPQRGPEQATNSLADDVPDVKEHSGTKIKQKKSKKLYI